MANARRGHFSCCWTVLVEEWKYDSKDGFASNSSAWPPAAVWTKLLDREALEQQDDKRQEWPVLDSCILCKILRGRIAKEDNVCGAAAAIIVAMINKCNSDQ